MKRKQFCGSIYFFLDIVLEIFSFSRFLLKKTRKFSKISNKSRTCVVTINCTITIPVKFYRLIQIDTSIIVLVGQFNNH